MNCQEVQAFLDGLILAEPEQECSIELREHFAACESCRRDYEAARGALVLLRSSQTAGSTTALRENIMSKIEAVDTQVLGVSSFGLSRRSWRVVVAGVFAVLVAMFAVGVPFLSRPDATVYAVERSIKAAEGLRTVHVRMAKTAQLWAGEIWAQLDDKGDLVKVRMTFPETEDGPKDVLYSRGEVRVWFRQKNSCVVSREPQRLQQLKLDYLKSDPKHLLQEVRQMQGKGGVSVDIRKAGSDDQPVVWVVTDSARPGSRDVYKIDPKTDLLVSKESYEFLDGKETLVRALEFLDSNRPLPSEVFALDLPKDTVLIDQLTQQVGLEKGTLGDNEIAVKVVREFLTAMIDEDYAKVGLLWGGIPADRARKDFGRITVTRIISVGKPTPHPETRSLRVPCKVEMEVDGKKREMESGPLVREVEGQPGRWCIHGGF